LDPGTLELPVRSILPGPIKPGFFMSAFGGNLI